MTRMIRQPHQFLPALVAMSIAVLGGAGCTKTAPAPRPVGTNKGPAKAVVGQAGSPAAGDSSAAGAVAPSPQAGAGVDERPAVGDLLATLAAADGDRRVTVIDEIGAIGQNALPALDALVAAFADEDPRVRWHAARAVGLIGEDARGALPAIAKLLGDADPIVVTQAAAALASIREDDGRDQIPAGDAAAYAAVIDPLAKTAIHPDGRARRAAVRALRRYTSLAELGPLVSQRLADADPGVLMSALHTLADMGDDAVPFLLEALQDPKSRYWAEVALAELGPAAAAATAPLALLAAEGAAEERLPAILALASIGEAAAPAGAAAVIGALESGDAALRLPAAFALGRMKAAAGTESLERVALGDDAFLVSVAAWALARIHPEDAPRVEAAIARLRRGLVDPDPDARVAAVNGLSDLAAAMSVAVREELAGEFMRLVADGDPRVGRAAGAALIRLGRTAVPSVQAKLADPALRLTALEILSAIGPAAAPAVGDLVKALGEADADTRGEAAVALAAIGGEAALAVPQLQRILEDPSAAAGLRYAAAYALGKIGPAAAAAEPTLRQLAESSDELLATVAAWAGLQVMPGDASRFEVAIPLLRRALRGEREMVRLEAAVALGEIGPAASSAVPILELVSEEDSVKQVREAAAVALAKISGK